MNAHRLNHVFQLVGLEAMSVLVSLGQVCCVNGVPAQGGLPTATWGDCDVAQAEGFKPVVEDGDIKTGVRGTATTKFEVRPSPLPYRG